jgi:transcriptional regulator with XRE-family HTH domain
MPRLVTPDRARITRLCDEKGWGAMDLAHAAGIAIATAGKIIRGEPVFRKSLILAAAALGEEYVNLIEGGRQLSDESQEDGCVIHVHIPIKREMLDDDQVKSFIELLKRLIGGEDDIDMTDIKDGSTILTLTLSISDFEKLLTTAELQGEDFLKQLGVEDIIYANISLREKAQFMRSLQERRNRKTSDSPHSIDTNIILPLPDNPPIKPPIEKPCDNE